MIFLQAGCHSSQWTKIIREWRDFSHVCLGINLLSYSVVLFTLLLYLKDSMMIVYAPTLGNDCSCMARWTHWKLKDYATCGFLLLVTNNDHSWLNYYFERSPVLAERQWYASLGQGNQTCSDRQFLIVIPLFHVQVMTSWVSIPRWMGHMSPKIWSGRDTNIVSA